jgi:hypothetical protein
MIIAVNEFTDLLTSRLHSLKHNYLNIHTPIFARGKGQRFVISKQVVRVVASVFSKSELKLILVTGASLNNSFYVAVNY